MSSPRTSSPELRWSVPLGAAEGYYINSVSISNDGSVVVAGTFKHSYGARHGTATPDVSDDTGTFGTYCFKADGTQLWQDTFQGNEGIYATAVSGDGTVAASGGWLAAGQALIRAYAVDGDGTPLFSYTPDWRANALALSNDGSVLVAGADAVYLFQRTNGVFPSSPAIMSLSPGTKGAQSIAITGDGSLFVTADAAKDSMGHDVSTVYRVENSGGTIGATETCLLHDTVIHAVAMTPDGAWFVASGTDTSSAAEEGVLYLFNAESIGRGTYADKLIVQSPPPEQPAGPARNVAITADGSRIAVVANAGSVGVISIVAHDAGALAQQWTKVTSFAPNSTSLDAAGKYVSIADGYPDGHPGQFILCDAATGEMLWTYPTDNMNWPMVLSADGSAIAAGSDNGTVYYFTPTAVPAGV